MKTFRNWYLRQYCFPGFFLITGLALRLYFSSLAYRDLVFDMKAYVNFAEEILKYFWIADCCTKNMGYPLFLALIFQYAGGVNVDLVRFIQVIGDTAVGILFYLSAKSFLPRATGLLFFAMYMLNPFTSAMTGLILPDSFSLVHMGILVYLVSRPSFFRSARHWFLCGGMLGIMILTRPQFLYLAYFLIFLLVVFLIENRRRASFVIITIAGILIPSTYSLISYHSTYGVFTLRPPYSFQSALLYLIFYQIKPYPEVIYEGEHEEERRVWMEYALTPVDKRQEFSEKYNELFLKKIQSDWPLFFYNWARKAWWIWDKDHIFIYHDPFYPYDRWPLRILNSGLLLFFAYGIFRYIRINSRSAVQNPIFLLSVILFLQITFLYSLVSSEARHALIYYPILMLWAAYGITSLMHKA